MKDKPSSDIAVFVLSGESMKPLMKTGDVFMASKVFPEKLKYGDIVVFEKNGKLVSHSIIKVKREGTDIKVLTKGLNRNEDDGWTDGDVLKFEVEALKKGKHFLGLNRTKKTFYCALAPLRKKIRNCLFEFSVKISPLFRFMMKKGLIKVKKIMSQDEELVVLWDRSVLKRRGDNREIHPFFRKGAVKEEDLMESAEKQGKTGNVYMNPDLVFRIEGDEGLVYNVKTGDFRIINETGCAILKLANGNFDKKGIIDLILEEYESKDQEEMMVKEVGEFIDDLSKRDIIRLID
ncbi:signal peptidase I [candidate division WOR-3 bacterium]|nr:signal peptidase I [candidate division WOR-3 bacterium]